MTDSTGTTVRAYDELNRVVLKAVPNIGESKYIYDITEGVEQGTYGEKTIDPKGNEVLKVYDKIGRLSKVIDGGKTTSYNYYDNGNLKSLIYPDGSGEYYTYYGDNSCSKLTNKKADGTVIDSYSYTYDGARNMLTKVDGKGKTTYSYDNLNRLKTTVSPDGVVISYEYDASGNRVLETINNAVVTNYKYNDQNRLSSTITKTNGAITNTVEYTYDNNGNQITSSNGLGQITKNSYNEFNELIKTITADGKTIINMYNGEGKRVAKISDGVTRRYLYEGEKVILEVDDNGAVIGRNIYGTNLVSRIAGGVKGYYFYNGHGDVTSIIGEDGTILATYYYDEFGNIKSSTGNFDNQYRYAGYQYDSETGNYYLIARMYDPNIARFLQEDTYRGDPNDPLSLNLYTYCHNNPIIYDDPTGHFLNVIIGSVVGATAGLAITAISDLLDDGKLNKDVDEYVGSAAEGAVGGAIAGATGGGSLLLKATGAAAGTMLGNATRQLIENGEVDEKKGIEAGTTALVTEGLLHGAGKVINKLEPFKNTEISSKSLKDSFYSIKDVVESKAEKFKNFIDDQSSALRNKFNRSIIQAYGGMGNVGHTVGDQIGNSAQKSSQYIMEEAYQLTGTDIFDPILEKSSKRYLLNDIQLLANKGVTQSDFYVGPEGHVSTTIREYDIYKNAEYARDALIENTPGAKRKAMAIGAYDLESGNVVADFAGEIPNNINSQLINKANQIGGVGSKGVNGKNTVGACAEFRSANQLLNTQSYIENIRFTKAIRPRTGEIKPTCNNCLEIFSDSYK